MSRLPKRISPQPVRHSRTDPREGRLGIMPQCGIGSSGSMTKLLAGTSSATLNVESVYPMANETTQRFEEFSGFIDEVYNCHRLHSAFGYLST
jgi:hypothetical protein